MTHVDSLLDGFQQSLRPLRSSTAKGFRRGADLLIAYCHNAGHDLWSGDIPSTVLCDFDQARGPERQHLRGALAFCRFLRRQGISIPLLDDPGLELVSRAQLAAFVEAAKQIPEPFASILQLIPMTGLRTADLMKLRVADVLCDEEGRAVQLTLKASAEPLVLTPSASAVLTTYLAAEGRSDASKEPDALVFGDPEQPFSPSTVSRRLRVALASAGLPDFNVAALREAHRFAHETPTGPAEKGAHLRLVVNQEEDHPGVEGAEGYESSVGLAGPPEEEPGGGALGDSKRSDRTSTPRREVRRLLPKSGVVYLRKRLDNGNTAYIAEYNVSDFGEDEAIEPFIARHLVPQHGPGDYLVYDQPRLGKPLHTFRFLAPSRAFRAHLEAEEILRTRARALGSEVPASRTDAAFHEAYQAVRREEDARRRDEELGRLIQTLRDENKRVGDENARLRGEIALLRRERDISPVSTAGLPPLAMPEDPLRKMLMDQHFDAARRNQEIVDGIIRKNLGVSEEGKEADLFGQLVALANGPMGHLLQEMASRKDSKRGALDRSRPWERQASVSRPQRAGEAASPQANRGVAGEGSASSRKEEGGGAGGNAESEKAKVRVLPGGAVPFLEKLEQAESEEEILENLFRALAALNLRDEWRDDIQEVFRPVIMDRRDEAMHRGWVLLLELVQAGHLSDPAARAVMIAIHESWDELKAQAIELVQRSAREKRAE